MFVFILTKFVPHFHVFVEKRLQVGIVVVDAPPLIYDYCNQYQQRHGDGNAQGYCNDKGCFHAIFEFDVKIKTARKTDVSLAELIVSNLENYIFRYSVGVIPYASRNSRANVARLGMPDISPMMATGSSVVLSSRATFSIR